MPCFGKTDFFFFPHPPLILCCARIVLASVHCVVCTSCLGLPLSVVPGGYGKLEFCCPTDNLVLQDVLFRILFVTQ